MKNYILFLVSILCINTSTAQFLVSASEGAETKDLRFSPEHAMGGYYADFIENITFIPLEYTNTSKIQWNPLIHVLDSTIVVANRFIQDMGLYFYTKEGVLLKKIKNLQNLLCKGCNKVQGIEDITADDKFVYVRCYIAERTNILKFDHQGNFISTESLYAGNFLKFASSTLIYNSPRDGHQNALTVAYTDGRLDTLLFYDSPFELSDDEFFRDITYALSADEDHIYFTAPYNPYIFQFNKGYQLEKVYNLILPLKYSLPIDSPRQAFSEEYQSRNPDIMISIDQIIPVDNKLLLEFSYNEPSYPKRFFTFDKSTEEWTNLHSLVPDSSSHFVPFLDKNMPLYIQGRDLYTIIYPSDILDYFTLFNKRSELLTSEPIVSLLKEQNPILVKFNLKQ